MVIIYSCLKLEYEESGNANIIMPMQEMLKFRRRMSIFFLFNIKSLINRPFNINPNTPLKQKSSIEYNKVVENLIYRLFLYFVNNTKNQNARSS